MNGPDAIWKTPAESLTYAMILGVAWGIVVAVSPWQASRYLMAKDEHTVIRSATITAGVVMLLYLVLLFGAASVNLVKADIDPAQESMIWAAMNIMPTLAGVLLMSGILAAGLSSASTFLSLVGFSVSNDLFAHTTEDDAERLNGSRKAMLGISLAALALAWAIPEGHLFWITYFAGTLFASCWGPVAFMSVWSSRITEAGAFWGIIAGLAGNLVDQRGGPAGPGRPAGDRGPDPGRRRAQLRRGRDRFPRRDGSATGSTAAASGCTKRPTEEFDPARLRRTLGWADALMAFGVLLGCADGRVLRIALPRGGGRRGGG